MKGCDMLCESDYISFQIARAMLEKRLSATSGEIAMWAWFGKRNGGFDPFTSCKPAPYGNATEPPRLYPPAPAQVSARDCSSLWLAGAYFRKTDIEGFDPAEVGRFISWGDLLTRWQTHGLSEAEVLMKVRGLIDYDEIDDAVAPIFGLTELEGSNLAPKEWALFKREQIEAIEKRDFLQTAVAQNDDESIGDEGKPQTAGAGGTAKSLPAGVPTAEIIEKFKPTDSPATEASQQSAQQPVAPTAVSGDNHQKAGAVGTASNTTVVQAEQQASESGTSKQDAPDDVLVAAKVQAAPVKRTNENQAFLLSCIDKGISANIASIWLHIRERAGEDKFLFKSASKSAATTVDDKKVEKKNLARALTNLLRAKKNEQETS